MMRVIVVLACLIGAQAALRATPTKVVPAVKAEQAVKPAPLAAKKLEGHVQLSAEQQKTMHSGCVNACKPSPVESKCVTACEAAHYKCIDETGPSETEKDTKACQDKVLATFTETKGLEVKKSNATGNATKAEGKKEEKKAEKKAKMFIQVERNIDDDNAEAAEMAKMEDQIDKLEGEDSDDSGSSGSDEEQSDEEESFVQTGKKSKNIDDDNAEAAEMAKMEDQIDKLEGEDSDDSGSSGSDEEQSDEEESFVQTKKSKTEWKPEPCDELEPGVPCTHLYEHPQGSTVVMPCPVERQTAPESCRALFGDKADGQQCPQITCPKALGVTMKLVCGGGCCPSCWAPDHVVKLDRHTTVDDAAVVDPAPQAPGTCSGVKCFELNCAPGFTKGFVNGDCCYSCVQGR